MASLRPLLRRTTLRLFLGVQERGKPSPIRAWREYRNLTQDALSEASGISKPYLSQIESGKRNGTFKKLAAIAKALSVPVDILAQQ
jgi:transcriptional regulator with XRE-family HTH domain